MVDEFEHDAAEPGLRERAARVDMQPARFDKAHAACAQGCGGCGDVGGAECDTLQFFVKRGVFIKVGLGLDELQVQLAIRALQNRAVRQYAGFEVFNDDYQQLPLATVAERARRAAVWLAEDVLRRSTPLPTQVRGQVLVARG